jgi:putative transposase
MRNRFTEEQIIGILKMQENGMSTKDIVRQHNITEQTFYRWKSKYGDMEVSEAKRLKQLEDENRRLKQIVADLSLDNQALKWVVQKNEFGLPAKKK